MSSRLHCPHCGAHDVTEVHVGRCGVTTTARVEAQAYGGEHGIPPVTTDDLWAHLGHVASAQDATRIVRQVIDLGWRPVVGSDPRRKWTPAPAERGAGTEPTAEIEGDLT